MSRERHCPYCLREKCPGGCADQREREARLAREDASMVEWLALARRRGDDAALRMAEAWLWSR